MLLAPLALLLVIRVYDTVGVPAHDLDLAKRTVAATLAPADVTVAWIDCSVYAQLRGECLAEAGPIELMARITTTPRGERDIDTLGHAFVNAEAESGLLATLYADRIARVAREARLAPGTLLGRALAHEVGHLLLGIINHPRRGIMRARWLGLELERRTGQDWMFSSQELSRLGEKLAERSRLSKDTPASADLARVTSLQVSR